MVIIIFQANLNLLWNMRLAKSIFFFPKQTGIGLENCTQFLGVTFQNQTGFGLEKDTEWNVAALQCSEDAEIKISLTHRLNHCTEWQGRQLSCPKELKMFHYWYLSCCETCNVRKLLSNEKWFTCGGILRSFINGEWPECALDGPFHPDGFFLEFHRGSNSR